MAPFTSNCGLAARFLASASFVALAFVSGASAKGQGKGQARHDLRIQLEPQAQSSQVSEVIVTSAKAAKESTAVPAVLDLNHYTFAGNVLSSPKNQHASHWVVVFCPNWWEPCQNIARPFEDLATEWQGRLNQDLLSSEVRFAKVDCATDKVLCNEQEVEGYPTVNHYVGGVRVAKWSGGQKNDAERLPKWLSKRFAAVSDSSSLTAASAGEVLSSYLVPGERAADVLLAVLGLAASFRLVLSNPELWEKGGSSAARSAGGSAETHGSSVAENIRSADGTRLRRFLPEQWRAGRNSMEL